MKYAVKIVTLLHLFSRILANVNQMVPTPTESKFYNVIIRRNIDATSQDLLCSGALISHEKVLTAGRCFFLSNHTRLPNKDFTVMVGNLGKTQQESRNVQIKDVLIHPDFGKNKRQDDIAIVILGEKIELESNDTTPIGFVTYTLPVGTECLMTTWLSFLSSWSIAGYLQELPVVIFKFENCSSNTFDGNKSLCVYGRDTTLEGVYFLPGTPLVCNNVLAGISSQTIRYNQPISYVSFTNINYYWHWIANNVANKKAVSGIIIEILIYFCLNLL